MTKGKYAPLIIQEGILDAETEDNSKKLYCGEIWKKSRGTVRSFLDRKKLWNHNYIVPYIIITTNQPMIENSFYMKAETWTAKELQNTFSSIVTVEAGYLNSSCFSWDFAHNSMYFPHHLCFRYLQGFQICFYVYLLTWPASFPFS